MRPWFSGNNCFLIYSFLQEDDEDEDYDEESDDDTAALLAELEKIKKERAEEQARKVTFVYAFSMKQAAVASPLVHRS